LGAAPLAFRAPTKSGSKKGEQIIMTRNTVTLVGNIGADAQTRTTQTNSRFVTFSVATKTSWKDKKTGEWQSRTEWHRCVVFGKIVERAAQLKKGDRVEVHGRLSTREFLKDSAKQRITEVRLTALKKLEPAAQQQLAVPPAAEQATA
jgi:single-strand DNA-binding protein